MKKILSSLMAVTLFSPVFTAQATPLGPLTFMEASNEAARVTQWQTDLRYFKTAVERQHGKFQGHEIVWLHPDLIEDGGEPRMGAWLGQPLNERRRQGFKDAMETLIAQVPELSDLAIGFGISRAVAYLGDSHFRPLEGLLHTHFLPLEMKSLINEGVQGYFIISTTVPFAYVLNHQVMAIDGLSVTELEAYFGAYHAFENVYDLRKRMAETGLVSVRWFEYMGLLADDEIVITVSDGVSESEVVLSATHWVIDPPGREAIGGKWDVHGRDPGPAPYVFSLQNEVMVFHEDTGILQVLMNDNWLGTGFMESLKLATEAGFGYTLGDALKVALGYELRDEPGGSVAELLYWWPQLGVQAEQGQVSFEGLIQPHFGMPPFWHESSMPYGLAPVQDWPVTQQVTELLATQDVRAIVLDNRYNRGGNHGLFTGLWDVLLEAVPVGYFFVTINNYAYSAGTMAPMALAARGAIVIGEPVSQNAIFYGMGGSEETNKAIQLPYSGLTFFAPNVVAHIHDRHLGLAGFRTYEAVDAFIASRPDWEWYTFRPDVLIELSLADWVANHDPVLAYVASRLMD